MNSRYMKQRIPQEYPDNHKAHIYKRMREVFGNQVLDALDEQNSKCVVELVENRRVSYENCVPYDEITFQLFMNNVSIEKQENETLEYIRGIVGMLMIAFLAIAMCVLFG